MYRIILILLVIRTQATIQLGRISNATWILNSLQIVNTYINISNITCDQCLCQMLEMNNLTTSISCQESWKTCQLLFWNATAQLQINLISVIYFQTVPKFLQTTINQQPLTTSVNSQSTEITTPISTTSTASTKETTSITSSASTTKTTSTTSSTSTTKTTSTTSSTSTTKTTSTTSSTSTTKTTSTTSSTSTTKTTSTTSSTSTTTITTTTTRDVMMNLLINPGAETGTLDPWTPSSSSAPVVNNGTGYGGTVSPYDGSYTFYGSTGGGTLYQNVPLTTIFSTEQLDSSSLIAKISFWERSLDTNTPDTGQVNLFFLSATNTTISNVSTGPKACTIAWCYVTGDWFLPMGTRTIQYVMEFVVNAGDYADAWIDDNSLIIT